MEVVCLASNRPGTGKTAMAAALAFEWSEESRGVAYLRPCLEPGQSDPDTEYMRGLVSEVPHAGDGVGEAPVPDGQLQTVSLGSLIAQAEEFAGQAASQGHRLVVEVPSQAGQAVSTWEICRRIAEAVGGSVVAVVDYEATIDVGRLEADLRPVRDVLTGILVNAAPPYRCREAALRLSPAAGFSAGWLLGVVPEDRMMLAPTVGQLAQRLEAEWVLGERSPDGLVCHVLIGGNLMDSGPTYFSRHEDKAVVVRGDRPDIQLAALTSPAACLVLTNGHKPIPYVYHEAMQREVPVLVVEGDTHATAGPLGSLASQGSIYHRRKTQRFLGLLRQNCQPGFLGELLA